MNANRLSFRRLLAAGLSCLCWSCLPAATAGPVKVFVLAGQSNMEGKGKLSTLEYLGKDPKDAALFKKLKAADGSPLFYPGYTRITWEGSPACTGPAPARAPGALLREGGADAAYTDTEGRLWGWESNAP